VLPWNCEYKALEEQPSAEENRTSVREANSRGELVSWSPVSTACPGCGQRGVLEVRQVMDLQAAGFSLAGVQLKFPGRLGWEFRCTSCGESGPAEPK
jgi:predicted RNA-binding Zn-ribbon protein involved in translation (DUF1610 family)